MNETNIKEYKPEVTDERRIEIAYKLPYAIGSKTIYTVIKQKDFLKIIRQIKNEELKDHLKRFVEYIDSFSTYNTDVLGQTINRKKTNEYRDVEVLNWVLQKNYY